MRLYAAMENRQIPIVWNRLSTQSRRLLLERAGLHYTLQEQAWEHLARHERKAIEHALTAILTFLASAGIDHAQARMAAA